MRQPSTHAEGQTPPKLEEAKDPQFAYTLAKGLEVLRAFDAATPSLGNREISQRTGIGRPTVVRLTRTLALLGYLKYHEQTARYRLAAGVLSFAYPLLCQLGVRQIARPHMQELADFARGAVSLAMRGGDHMVLIESCVDKNAPSGRPDVGAIRQFGDTSLGHAYLFATTDKERKEIEDLLKERDPQAWPALRNQLAASRKTFLAKGFCIVPSPGAGMVAISVPLGFMVDDEMLVMNCAVAQFYLQPDTLEKQVGPRLLNLVRLLQTSLGRR
ncbi:IclR family transcriptional regulator [Limnohabitans sp.]|jgi:DNA-binding IclR family transcriptional regulator|uniref:IclR family transcriptional regulator n=1 Tax=Limnohabitans sp. TaxID=1907725 RepID=UPI0037C146D5